ncbi:indole-3-glycerol phosphate synthase TrpC [Candidatus Margulisiibacteriota bacterium]
MKPSDFLTIITKHKKKEIETLYSDYGIQYFKDKCQKGPDSSFYRALSQNGLNLIAEVKKASPSKGIIRKDFNHISIAKGFESSGASCISVLTDTDFFQGKPEFIPEIKQHTKLPVLRKDFIMDPIQVYQSKYLGADAILLIKAILNDTECQNLLNLASELKLDVLLEIHSEEELEQIKNLSQIRIIGINNRNLHTFNVDISLAPKLLGKINTHFSDICTVAESGYFTAAELSDLENTGFNGVLIGEGLAKNPELTSFFSNKKGKEHAN